MASLQQWYKISNSTQTSEDHTRLVLLFVFHFSNRPMDLKFPKQPEMKSDYLSSRETDSTAR